MSSPARQWYSAAELSEMKLSIIPTSKPGIKSRAEKEKWLTRQVAGNGGKGGVKTEYMPPAKVLQIIKEQLLHEMIKGDTDAGDQANQTNTHKKAAVAVKEKNSSGSQQIAPITQTATLKSWQRETAEARAAICQEVKRLAQIGGTERAIRKIVDLAASGEMSPHLQQLVPIANAKSGQVRTLSRTSIYRWLSDLAEGGVGKLAPKERESSNIPAWAPALMSLMAQPQKPTLKYCIEQIADLLPAGVAVPSYSAADRFIKKISKVDAQRGRMGNRELKNIRPFVRRDTSGMWPGDAYTADGHTFDAEIAHPAHGRPFRPEITTVIDIATRRAVGWSTDLAESTWSVLDALRHACTSSGIPAIFYVDNGSGFKNAAMSNEATGFMARLAITLTHSLPYNSQARGIIERSHQTIWVNGAKQLATYMGKDMDGEAKQMAFKITRADIRTATRSKVLMEWTDFVRWCEKQVEEYNNRPHRALPKVTDNESGKKRHQSPNEAWAQAVAEGWKKTEVEAADADDLFRPYKECKVARGEIRLYNNIYFHHDLEHYHGETVRVGYDIHDASQVWVRDSKGRLICVAGFEANKRSYFPESFIQQAAEKRAQGRISRAMLKVEEAEAELSRPQQLVYEAPIELPVMDIQDSIPGVQIAEAAPVAQVLEFPAKVERPRFGTDAEKYVWLVENEDQSTADDDGWLAWYRGTSEYEDLFSDKEVAARS